MGKPSEQGYVDLAVHDLRISPLALLEGVVGVLSCSLSLPQCPHAARAIPDGHLIVRCLPGELLGRSAVKGLLCKKAPDNCFDGTGPRDGEGAGCWCYHEHLLQAGTHP